MLGRQHPGCLSEACRSRRWETARCSWQAGFLMKVGSSPRPMLRISSIETEDPRSGRPSTLSRVGVVEFPENRSRLIGIAYAPESPLASRSGTERRTAATAVLDSIQRWGTGVRMDQQNAEVCFQGRAPRSSNLFKSMLMVVAFATMV